MPAAVEAIYRYSAAQAFPSTVRCPKLLNFQTSKARPTFWVTISIVCVLGLSLGSMVRHFVTNEMARPGTSCQERRYSRGSNIARAQAYKRPLTPNRSRDLSLYEIYEWPRSLSQIRLVTSGSQVVNTYSGLSLARAGGTLISTGDGVY